MAAYEVLLLNTAIPQIQAAQAGDTYVVPRDIAFSTVASLAAGTEALPSLVATGDINTGFWFPAADTIAASTGGTRRLTLDSSGNLGLGVTSPTAKLDVYATNFAGGPAIGARYNASNDRIGFNIANSNGYAYLGYNTNNAASSDTPTYDLSKAATQLRMDGGSFKFNIAASGTAGNAITFTQAMTLDASGNLVVGATTAEARLQASATNPTNGVVQLLQNLALSAQTGAKIKLDVGNVGESGLGIPDGSSNALAFFVGGMTSASERARITSGGNLDLQNNIGLGGTSATTSGTGITFPATQNASSNANTLDDYEEGTFTATLGFPTSTGSLTYSQQSGRYIKIGNMVFVSVFIAWSANNYSANTGSLALRGLPFAFSSTADHRGGLYITYSDTAFTGLTIYQQAFRAEAGETNANFNYSNSTAGNINNTVTSYASIQSSGAIMITGSYPVA